MYGTCKYVFNLYLKSYNNCFNFKMYLDRCLTLSLDLSLRTYGQILYMFNIVNFKKMAQCRPCRIGLIILDCKYVLVFCISQEIGWENHL